MACTVSAKGGNILGGFFLSAILKPETKHSPWLYAAIIRPPEGPIANGSLVEIATQALIINSKLSNQAKVINSANRPDRWYFCLSTCLPVKLVKLRKV